ncbi:MAG: adenylate kinase [Bacteroidota bacterium]|jgi:adenylate kinase
MLNIVLFGPPGAGKGTQSARLISKYALVHLSTGDIFRANIKNQTTLGTLAKSYIDKGKLVPDEVTIQMLESECNKHPKAKGFIFDGFPRTHAQAAALDKFLRSKGTRINMMLALEVEEEELRKRLLLRGKESGRADDQDPSVIQKRIDVYNAETMPVKSYYNAQRKYFGVDGIGDIDEIFEKLCEIINAKPLTGKPKIKKAASNKKQAKKKSTAAPKASINNKASKKAKKKKAVSNKKSKTKSAAKTTVNKKKASKKSVKKAAKKAIVKKVKAKKPAKKSATKAKPKKLGKKKVVKKSVSKKAPKKNKKK